MSLLAVSKAAIRSGFSVELLQWLSQNCPKRGEERQLPIIQTDGIERIDQDELDRYLQWLRAPWPRPTGGGRPRIPVAIARDVKEECHHECAICGRMDHGELAHIDAVAKTLNNSPDNLLLLCPNHHTEYDYGFRPASNLDRETVLAAKRMKRAARRRMLLHEDNVTALLDAVIRGIHAIQPALATNIDTTLRDTYITELRSLIGEIPGLTHRAQDAAAKDQTVALDAAALLEVAPTLRALTETAPDKAPTTEVVARDVVDATRHVVALDEMPCPHCHGRGVTGLMGRLCSFCGGDQYVSDAKARAYDETRIDEVTCPHCDGRGARLGSRERCARTAVAIKSSPESARRAMSPMPSTRSPARTAAVTVSPDFRGRSVTIATAMAPSALSGPTSTTSPPLTRCLVRIATATAPSVCSERCARTAAAIESSPASARPAMTLRRSTRCRVRAAAARGPSATVARGARYAMATRS